ncbi:MAG: hypothetical protein N2Z74_02385 [Syntrophales bacterium]|nr:hypothetical protein [Syntrophales bacterium]
MKKEQFTSLDYPLYERMKIKAPRAARLWLLGDRLFQIGLLLTMLCLPILFYAYREWGMVILTIAFAVGLGISIAMLGAGIYLKRESYKQAMAAGIDVTRI